LIGQYLHYPWRAYLATVLQHEHQVQKTSLRGSGFFPDVCGRYEELSAGFLERQAYFVDGETEPEKDLTFRKNEVPFIGPLHTDFSNLGKLIVPGQFLRVTVTLSEGPLHMFLPKTVTDDGKYRLETKRAFLHVPHFNPTDEYARYFFAEMKLKPAIYHFEGMKAI
jgi:hypothetical protein